MKESRKEYIKRYFDDIKTCLDELSAPPLVRRLIEIGEVILDAREKRKTIFVMGNGGSASTASHFASDLAKGTVVDGGKRIRAMALTDNIPQLTAWANDQSYDDIFIEQLKNMLEKDDVVIGISCSGNSMNVIKALDYATGNGAFTIGFTGFDGGKLKSVAMMPLVVPCQNMQRCEDMHLLLTHLLSSMIRAETPIARAKVVFVDRDGVINENREDYVKSWEEFRFIPGAKEAIKLLNENDFRVIVVTNQSAVGRGLLSSEELDKINGGMIRELERFGARIDAIYVCPHRPDEVCDCRKPKTGLVEKATRDFDINIEDAWVIGDSPSDIELGRNVGCKTILVSTLQSREVTDKDTISEFVAPTLLDAAQWLVDAME